MVEDSCTLSQSYFFHMMKERITRFIYSVHYDYHSGWLHKRIINTLIVDVCKIHAYDNKEGRTNVILLFINLDFVDTLILRTCFMVSSWFDRGSRVNWVDYPNSRDYWYLEYHIKMSMIKEKLADDYSTKYITDYEGEPNEIFNLMQYCNNTLIYPIWYHNI